MSRHLVERRMVLRSLVVIGGELTGCGPGRARSLVSAPGVDRFPDLASLRFARGAQGEATVQVAGHSAPGDGGGGLFHWDAGAIVDDDDGMVIAPAGDSGVPGRWRRTNRTGLVSIAWFGATPNDRGAAARNARAIQRAIRVAQGRVGQEERGAVRIPHGTFYIDHPLVLSSAPLSIRGEGMRESGLAAAPGGKLGADEAMIAFADASQNTRFEITEIFLHGENLAGYGVRSSKVDHLLLRRVQVMETLKVGVELGYGWSNSIQNCEVSYNHRDGIALTSSSNNNVTVTDNKIFANGGLGLKVLGGAAVNVHDNGFEKNRAGAIYLFMVLGGRITGNYFEQNAEAGLIFSSPAEAVHADIVVNGSSNEHTLGYAYPTAGLEIAHSYCVSHVEGSVFVWLGGAWPVRLSGNTAPLDVPRRPLIGCVGDRRFAYSSRISMDANSGFSSDHAIRGGARGVTADLATWSSDEVPTTNHATDDVFRYARLAAGGGGMIQRRGRRAGQEALEITGAATSDIWGFSVDLAAVPDLAGRWIYFAVEAAASSPHANLGVAIRTAAGWIYDTEHAAGNTDWSVRQLAVRAPTTGVLQVGVAKIAGKATDSVYFAKPVLAAVGAPYSLFYREPRVPRWVNSRAPERGAWSQGDVVYDPAPRGAGVLGWVCVQGGSPGVWKAFGAVSR